MDDQFAFFTAVCDEETVLSGFVLFHIAEVEFCVVDGCFCVGWFCGDGWVQFLFAVGYFFSGVDGHCFCTAVAAAPKSGGEKKSGCEKGDALNCVRHIFLSSFVFYFGVIDFTNVLRVMNCGVYG